MRWFVLVALAGALSACDTEVVLGLFHQLAADAGDVDGGRTAFGSQDAGTPDLVLVNAGGWLLEAGTDYVVDVTVTNPGLAAALDTSVDLGWPMETTFVSSAGCVANPPTARCAIGVLSPQASRRVTTTLNLGAAPHWLEISARAFSTSLDQNPADNYLVLPVALTPTGTVPVALSGERSFSVQSCFDPTITSFSRCVVGRIQTGQVLLHADGGVEDATGVFGFWSQSTHHRNVAWRYVNRDGTRGASFVGGSVSATCFEGVFDDSSGAVTSGAWRGCLN